MREKKAHLSANSGSIVSTMPCTAFSFDVEHTATFAPLSNASCETEIAFFIGQSRTPRSRSKVRSSKPRRARRRV